MNKALILFLMIFILISPVSANILVSDPSNGVITAPAAAYTNNQLIFSDKNPNQAVLNYVNGKGTIIVGDISLSGKKVPADSASLSKYWTKSDVVVVGTGQDRAAALIAIKNNAPLLVVSNSVPDSVNNEIQRLSPKKIIICASPSSIPDSTLNIYPNIQKERFWKGNDANTIIAAGGSNQKIKAPLSLMPIVMTLWKDAAFEVGDKVTINDKTTLWSSNDIITSIVMNSYATKNLPVIYITSDDFISESTDKEMLNNIKKAISGSANVIIDENSPKPGEAPRTVKNAPGGIAAYVAAADPGSMVDLVYGIKKGYLKADAQKLNGIVFINYGKINLENTSYMPRAYDDNYSNQLFAGLYSPAMFLEDAGIDLLQPNIGTSSQQEETNKIAAELIDAAYSSNKNQLNSNYNSGLIGTHQINPENVAYASQSVLKEKSPEMGYSKWMYLASQYVGGYPIKNTDEKFSKSNLSGDSTYFGVLTIDEYRTTGKTVSEYMASNKTVPESIKVQGRTLRKPDLEYLFARLTYDHTSRQNMTFPKYIFINRSNEPFDIIIKYIRSSFYQIFG
jgi:hypothetical protein